MSFYFRLISRKPEGQTDAGFARSIGVGKDQLWRWKLVDQSGRKSFLPKSQTIVAIAEKLQVSPGWLAFGEDSTREYCERGDDPTITG